MTLGSSIKQFVENMARSLAITSASPDYTNRVKAIEWFGEGGDFDGVFRQDVIKIIQDEIKIQMVTVGEKSPEGIPKGSDKTSEMVGLARQGVGIAQNPASIVSMGLKLLPQAALVTFAMSMIPIILQELQRPGGLMDVRWKRQVTDEINGFMDRQTQKNTQMGIRGVTIQSRAGFVGINGANNSNNLREVREGGINKDRLARIDLIDHTRGLFN